MVKVNGPAMSLDASGSLGGALVFSKWKGRPYVRILVKPSNPRSVLQTGMRAMFAFLAQQWASLSGAEQATWDALGEQLVASPFNAYMKENQQNWRNFLAPSEAYPATRLGTDPVVVGAVATAGTRQISITQAVTTINDGWGSIIHRGLTGFTPAPSTAIAVVQTATTGATTTYIDTPLDPGTYFYRVQNFTIQGELIAAGAEISATVL